MNLEEAKQRYNEDPFNNKRNDSILLGMAFIFVLTILLSIAFTA